MSNNSKITITNYHHRFFDDKNVICGMSYQVAFSKYYLKAKELLNKLSLRQDIESKYVLCPIYGKKQDSKWIPTDIQIGVTGKAKTTETTKYAVNRELGEEIGIIVKPDLINEHIKSDLSNPSLFVLNVTNTISLDSDMGDIFNYDYGVDDHNRKIGICVIGVKEDIIKMLLDKSFNYRLKNREKDIIGIISIPIILALNYMNKK